MTTNEQLARYAQLPFPVETELGRCAMPVREILSLAPGSLIRLSRKVGAKVDVYVGGALFGSAELVQAEGATFRTTSLKMVLDDGAKE